VKKVAGNMNRRVRAGMMLMQWSRKLIPERHKVKHIERNISVIHKDEDVGGPVRVTRDEAWVLQGDWTVMRWRRCEGKWGELVYYTVASVLNLFLVESNPVSVWEPFVLFDVSNAILEISIAFREVNLQLVSQQVFYVGAKVRWKSYLS